MDENEKFEAAYKFGLLVEHLLRVGISVEALQEGIRIIAEAIE